MLDREIAAVVPVIPRGRRAFLFALLACALAHAGCQRTRENERPPVRVRRIVSLLPAATDALVALGSTARIVARSDYDTAAVLSAVPSLGRSLVPSSEAILALQPELIILPRFVGDASRLQSLQQRGITMLAPRLHTLGDLYSLIDTLGVLLQIETQARSLTDSLRAALALRAEPATNAPTVLYLIWHNPVTVAGPGSYIDELIAIADARNAAADLGTPWPNISLESIVQRQPDYLILPRGKGHVAGVPWLFTQPGWRDLSAVRNGRVIEVDGDLFSQLSPRIVEASRILNAALRPIGASQ
jgi:ABC-type Fe3+-hydroxamate transport system substrate-binding protein